MTPRSRELDAALGPSPVERAAGPDPPQAPDFNRLAPFYRWMEWLSFGPWLGWCRRAFLGDLRHARRALILGDGDGRFTARLLHTNPEVEVHAVDGSAAMLRALVRRSGANVARVRTKCYDARAWRPTAGVRYDLIVTHFFLDCLTSAEVRALAAWIGVASQPHSRWIVSEFAIPSTRFGRCIARPVVGFLYLAFGLLTGLKVRRLPDYRAALAEAGWTLEQRRPRLAGLLVSEMWTRSSAPAPD